MKIIQPLTLKIDDELWTEFKNKIPRTKKLNDALVELVKKEMEKRKRQELRGRQNG